MGECCQLGKHYQRLVLRNTVKDNFAPLTSVFSLRRGKLKLPPEWTGYFSTLGF